MAHDPTFTNDDLAALKAGLRILDESPEASLVRAEGLQAIVEAARAVVVKNRPRNYCLCSCGAPLVSTMEFYKVEWFCQECGSVWAFLSTMSAPWSRQWAAERNELFPDRRDPARLDHARAHLGVAA